VGSLLLNGSRSSLFGIFALGSTFLRVGGGLNLSSIGNYLLLNS